jgi:hypothetical protein
MLRPEVAAMSEIGRTTAGQVRTLMSSICANHHHIHKQPLVCALTWSNRDTADSNRQTCINWMDLRTILGDHQNSSVTHDSAACAALFECSQFNWTAMMLDSYENLAVPVSHVGEYFMDGQALIADPDGYVDGCWVERFCSCCGKG